MKIVLGLMTILLLCGCTKGSGEGATHRIRILSDVEFEYRNRKYDKRGIFKRMVRDTCAEDQIIVIKQDPKDERQKIGRLHLVVLFSDLECWNIYEYRKGVKVILPREKGLSYPIEKNGAPK